MLGQDYSRRRRHLHMIVFSVVLAGNLILIAAKRESPPDFLPYAVVGALSATSVLMLWLYPQLIRWVECLACSTLLGLNIAALYQDLFIRHNHVGELVYWVILCYLLAYMVLRPWQALLLCAALALVKLGMTVYHVVLFAESIAGFVGFYASQAVAITLFYFVARNTEENRQEIERLAHTDFLTGQANRRSLYELISAEVQAADRYGRSFSVLIFDIDHFKQVNDTYGHFVGDQVLKAIADLVAGAARATDRLGRWGGEEFILYLRETGAEEAAQMAHRLQQLIAGHRFEGVGGVTASFGGTAYRQSDTPETLLKRADDCLYLAKQQGRNRVQMAT